ncbi:MAG: hypothetical protein QNJ55_32035 [Xenococcus sp. MO_188.B8]|nr:hypothetical protein [Xenococcus sp. MO_188.B8]
MDLEHRIQAFLGTLPIIGGLLLILVERLIITNSGFIRVDSSLTREDYANDYFTPAALIVVLVSAICAVVWYFIALKWSPRFAPPDMRSARFTWIFLSILVIVSFVGVWFLFGTASSKSLLWFAGFLIINIVITYWLSTVLSTPDNMIPAVFLADLLRR